MNSNKNLFLLSIIFLFVNSLAHGQKVSLNYYGNFIDTTEFELFFETQRKVYSLDEHFYQSFESSDPDSFSLVKLAMKNRVYDLGMVNNANLKGIRDISIKIKSNLPAIFYLFETSGSVSILNSRSDKINKKWNEVFISKY